MVKTTSMEAFFSQVERDITAEHYSEHADSFARELFNAYEDGRLTIVAPKGKRIKPADLPWNAPKPSVVQPYAIDPAPPGPFAHKPFADPAAPPGPFAQPPARPGPAPWASPPASDPANPIDNGAMEKHIDNVVAASRAADAAPPKAKRKAKPA